MNSETSISLKICSKCKQPKLRTTEFFYHDKSKSDSLSPRCKICKTQDGKESYLKNKITILCRNARWRTSHKEERKQLDRSYYLAHREQCIASTKAWIIRNRAKHNTYVSISSKRHRIQRTSAQKEWLRKNPAKTKVYSHRRLARKRNATGSFSEIDVGNQFRDQDGLCYYCKIPLKNYHLEHKTPLSRGGSNEPENLVCACRSCNVKKWKRTEEEFLALRDRYPFLHPSEEPQELKGEHIP